MLRRWVQIGLLCAAFMGQAMASPSTSPLPNATSLRNAVVHAQAVHAVRPQDTTVYGPYWVTFASGYCNIAKLYLIGLQLYGEEVGCADSLGQSYTAVIDPESLNVYLTVPTLSGTNAGLWTVFLNQGTSDLVITTQDSNGVPSPATYGPFNVDVATTLPDGATN